MARNGLHWYDLTGVAVFAVFFALITWHMRDIRRRALRRILSGL
jgi:hypothetical protein